MGIIVVVVDVVVVVVSLKVSTCPGTTATVDNRLGMGAACSAQRRVDVESPSPAPTPTAHADSPETVNFGSAPGTRPSVSDFDESERLSGCGHVLILYCSIKEFAADAVLFPDTWTAGVNGVPAWKDEAAGRDINGRVPLAIESLHV